MRTEQEKAEHQAGLEHENKMLKIELDAAIESHQWRLNQLYDLRWRVVQAYQAGAFNKVTAANLLGMSVGDFGIQMIEYNLNGNFDFSEVDL